MENLTVDKSESCQIYRNFFTKKQFFVNLNLFQALQKSSVKLHTFDAKFWQKETLHYNFGNFFAKKIDLSFDGKHTLLPKTQLICEKLPTITQTSEIHCDNVLMNCENYFTKTINTADEERDEDYSEQRKTLKDATVQTAFSVLGTDNQCQCYLKLFEDSKCASNKYQQEEVDSFRSFNLILDKKANDGGVELPSNHGKSDFEANSSRKKSHLKTISRIRIGLSKRFKPRPLHNN